MLLSGDPRLLSCPSKGRHGIIFISAGWQWRSTSTSTPGWKDSAARRWKLRRSRWLRTLVYRTSGRSWQRTCQVRLDVALDARCVIEITLRCEFGLWCVYWFPVGRNTIRRLSFLVRMRLHRCATSLPARMCSRLSWRARAPHLCVTGCNSLSGGARASLAW